jgi:hypothetical protein
MAFISNREYSAYIEWKLYMDHMQIYSLYKR